MQPFDYDVTKISFTSYLGGGDSEADAKLVVEAIIFKRMPFCRLITIPSDVEGGNPSYFYSYSRAGSVKFTGKMSQWNWCNNECTIRNGAGESVWLSVEMTNKVIAGGW